MKTKYDIGQEVFCIFDHSIAKTKIEKIKIIKIMDGIKTYYYFEDDESFDYYPEEDLFETLSELIKNIKCKFPEEFEEKNPFLMY
jgi:hypothetical protein